MLNVADPVFAGEWGKAAFDAVGPLLLIGWAEAGPGLIQQLSVAGIAPSTAGEAHAELPAGSSVERRPACPGPSPESGDPTLPRGIDEDLLVRARWEDAEHWRRHRRPTSAEALRRRLRIGAARSRALVTVVRAEADRRLQADVDEPVDLA
nr:hypothetical protein [Amycolatopsis nigrescens]